MFEKFLAGKTAVVTGSNSGIGLGIAHELAKARADLVLNSFTDTPEDHALADKLAAQHGVTVRYIQADMSKPAECRVLIERAGACDILVNNAGIQHVAPIPDFPVEKWNAIIAINLSCRQTRDPASSHAGTRPFLTVEVVDDGPGIPAEHHQRVFEPFFTTKEVGQGSGLGLSQVFGFASQSGGFVHLRSEPGQGTAVTIHLPAREH